MDVALAVLKITALLFAVIAFAFTVNYCAKPEDFFHQETSSQPGTQTFPLRAHH